MNTYEEIFNTVIKFFGFEHHYTIQIARWIERGDISIETMRATVEGWMQMGF